MHAKSVSVLAMLAGAFVASGCSTMAADDTQAEAGATAFSSAELEASQRRITELEAALAARERELADAESRVIDSTHSGSQSGASLFPPNPKTGECYARVMIPAKYETRTERILASEASDRIEIIPARYETVEETVLVREASTKLEIVPAVYGEVQERVLVKPASKKIVEVPAVYEKVTERVLDKPAHTTWKKGPAATQTANVLSQSVTDTGEVMCLVEIPATYKTVEKRVLVTPARTEEVLIPAEYKTVTKTVVKEPATTREVTIPAQYETVAVTKLVAPAEERRVAIPAEYQSVTLTEKVRDEQLEWRRVMCEVNMTRDNVLALQKALADEGYYKGGLDGIIGAQTLGAAQRYALDKSLPAGSNYIPMEVVESLNVRL